VKNILSTHIIYYKADHKKVFFFEKGPPTETAMFRCFAFKGAPNSNCFESNLLSKGPPTATEMRKYSAFEIH